MSGQKIIRRLLIGVPACVLLLVLGCLIVINTSAFRNYLRSEITANALKHAGVRVEIGALKMSWTRLHLELDNVLVHGAESLAAGLPPLASAKEIEVGVRFFPLLHGKVELSDLILEQPVVHLRIDARGNSNLPVVPPSKNSKGPGAIFDLEIGNCVIQSGEIFYNDAQIPLDAELHGLKFDAGYGRLTGDYTGTLSYDHGRFVTPQIEPIAHAAQMHFTASRTALSIDRLVITSEKSSISLNARLTNYAEPMIDGSYEGAFFTAEIAKTLRLKSLPLGEVAINGDLHCRPSARLPFLASIIVTGEARSERLAIPTNQNALDATGIHASFELKDANLRVQNAVANILGGQAHANWEMLHLGAQMSPSRLQATVQGVSLANASDAFAPADVRRIHFVGVTNADVSASWSGSINNAVAHLRLAIASPASTTSSDSSIPVTGLLQADFDGPRNTLSFAQSYLQTARTTLRISGTLDSRRNANSNLAVVATTADLREVSSLATIIQNAMQALNQPSAAIPELRGSATFNAVLSGAARDPRIRGQLTAEHFVIDRSSWRSLSLNVHASSSEVQIQNGMLNGESGGEIGFGGQAALQNWSIMPESKVSLHASASGLRIEDAENIANLKYPVSGILTAKVSVSGTRATPEGQALLTLSHGSAWGEQIENLAINANFHQGEIHSTLNVQLPAGTLSGDGNYKVAAQEFQAQLHGAGIKLENFSAIEKAGAVQGTLDFNAAASGTIPNPQLEANLTAANLIVNGQAISNLTAQVTVAHQHASLVLHSTLNQAGVEGKADVDLTGNRNLTASVDVPALPIAVVAANFLPERGSKISGQTELHLKINGPLSAPAQIEAHLDVPTFTAAYGDANIALLAPLKADYRAGTITVARTRLQGPGTDLTFSGMIPVKSGGTLAMSVDGSADLSALQKFVPGVQSSGKLNIHIASEGASPAGMHGQVQIQNAVLSADSVPVGIEGLNAQINLSGTRADIANLKGTAGGGTISATGFVTYGHEPSFNLAFNAQSVRVRYPEGLRSILSGQVNLRGDSANSALTGHVFVDRLSFTQAFDLAGFAGRFSEESSGAAPSSFASNMKLGVSLQSAQDINLTSSKLSLGGSASLNLTGTLANPVVLGRIALTSGEGFFLGKRFEVQNGTIEFVNPARTDPVLNLNIKTTIEQYDVTLTLLGTLDRLRTNYTSEPALPTADIIHLLAFGNTAEEAASAPSQSAGMGAESVLASGVSSQVSGKLENLAGISQLTIDPLAANSQGNPGAQVAIQQRVTGNLLLTFSTDVTSTQSQTVELQYQFSKRTSIAVLRDQNGGYGIDLRLHRAF